MLYLYIILIKESAATYNSGKKKMKNLVVTNLETLQNFPANAILIMYSDHYHGNSGDDIFITDNTGSLVNQGTDGVIGAEVFFKHFNMTENDRGVVSLKSITHEKGAFKAFQAFRNICLAYTEASYNLKKWENGETVWNVAGCGKFANNGCGDSATFVGSKCTMKFEDTKWYKRYCCAKESTVNRKRAEYNAAQIEFNAAIQNALIAKKNEAKKWFVENNISVRNAYNFIEGYIK